MIKPHHTQCQVALPPVHPLLPLLLPWCLLEPAGPAAPQPARGCFCKSLIFWLLLLYVCVFVCLFKLASVQIGGWLCVCMGVGGVQLPSSEARKGGQNNRPSEMHRLHSQKNKEKRNKELCAEAKNKEPGQRKVRTRARVAALKAHLLHTQATSVTVQCCSAFLTIIPVFYTFMKEGNYHLLQISLCVRVCSCVCVCFSPRGPLAWHCYVCPPSSSGQGR